MALTASGPIVIGGTKWPSITSTWITGAPASSTIWTCSESRPKSAAKIEGAMPLSTFRSGSTSKTDNGRTYTGRCSTSARSWSAPRNSDTPNAARSGAGSSRSGSGRAGSWAGARAHGRTGRRHPGSRRSCAPEPCDEESVGAVAVRERLQILRHGRMLPERQVGAQVCRGEILVSGQEGCHDPLVLDGRDRAGRIHKDTAGPQRRRSGLEDRALQPGKRLGAPGLAPARVGPRGERSQIRAGRVDQDAVEGRRDTLRRVLRAHVDDRRTHPLGGPAQGVRAARVL